MATNRDQHCEITQCTECEQPLAANAAHYRFHHDERRHAVGGFHVVSNPWLAILCPRCSLHYDLTRIEIYNASGRVGRKAYESHNPTQCAYCRRDLTEKEIYHSLWIEPVNLPSELDGPTLEFSLCGGCVARYDPMVISPKVVYPRTVRCHDCGKETPFSRAFGNACDDAPPDPHGLLPQGSTWFCGECFLGID